MRAGSTHHRSTPGGWADDTYSYCTTVDSGLPSPYYTFLYLFSLVKEQVRGKWRCSISSIDGRGVKTAVHILYRLIDGGEKEEWFCSTSALVWV
jgi:hypothetical protein